MTNRVYLLYLKIIITEDKMRRMYLIMSLFVKMTNYFKLLFIVGTIDKVIEWSKKHAMWTC